MKYFIISANDDSNLSEIDSIIGNEELEKHIKGTPKNITELKGGKLLIEVSNKEQASLITSLTSLANTPVTVTNNDRLNQVKGTIRFSNLPKFTDDQILKALKKDDAIDIYRFQKKVSGALLPLPIYLITFNKTELPEKVTIGWTKCKVRQYIPRPRRCFKCQRYGHGAKTCRAESSACATCGQSMDDDHPQPCNQPPSCVNCHRDHPSSSRTCSAYHQEEEILAVQTRGRLRYSDAKKQVLARRVEPTRTLASIVAGHTNKTDSSSAESLTLSQPIRKTHTPSSSATTIPVVTTNLHNTANKGALNRELPSRLQMPPPDTVAEHLKKRYRSASGGSTGIGNTSSSKRHIIENLFPMPPNIPNFLPPQDLRNPPPQQNLQRQLTNLTTTTDH